MSPSRTYHRPRRGDTIFPCVYNTACDDATRQTGGQAIEGFRRVTQQQPPVEGNSQGSIATLCQRRRARFRRESLLPNSGHLAGKLTQFATPIGIAARASGPSVMRGRDWWSAVGGWRPTHKHPSRVSAPPRPDSPAPLGSPRQGSSFRSFVGHLHHRAHLKPLSASAVYPIQPSLGPDSSPVDLGCVPRLAIHRHACCRVSCLHYAAWIGCFAVVGGTSTLNPPFPALFGIGSIGTPTSYILSQSIPESQHRPHRLIVLLHAVLMRRRKPDCTGSVIYRPDLPRAALLPSPQPPAHLFFLFAGHGATAAPFLLGP
ncbi:hypothetical protein K461DRAFT_270978 [Myriangium duriaei CBS 260.36]|uniref:Uncharacterized protein n=1 Tax=Myriangium duriaei CBS 260.36 TaxID=1168546 RepID=A0A9P4IVR2_9PEZI|nr:hypothetical protein K461DRAFT_270978 [Myriangium duriaei CBS 260.36]